MLHCQNDNRRDKAGDEKQKQQEPLRPLGEMCQNGLHASSLEPTGGKWKGR